MDQILKPFCHREPEKMIKDFINDPEILNVPDIAGAYIFASLDKKFVYPNGESKVIYIGKAGSLHQRLKTHYSIIRELSGVKKTDRNQFWWYPRYQYFVKFGCKVYFFTTRGPQDEQSLESSLLEKFYDRYHSIPVGNGAFSFRK